MLSCATICLEWKFHPTIESLFQISTSRHPLSRAINPQNRVVSQCPLLSHKSHNPLIFSYKYPDFSLALFLSTSPTQGMYPFTDISLLGIPPIYQGLYGTSNQESLSWEIPGNSLLGKLLAITTNMCF